jgi:hypothetical protein
MRGVEVRVLKSGRSDARLARFPKKFGRGFIVPLHVNYLAFFLHLQPAGCAPMNALAKPGLPQQSTVGFRL